jgi:hypothetical protein
MADHLRPRQKLNMFSLKAGLPAIAPASAGRRLELQEFAIKHHCRLVLTGDTKQHHSVQRGDALRILERSGAVAQAVLNKIYRQRIPELREAIEDLSKGRTGEGFDKLEKFGVYSRDSGRRRPPGRHCREAN